MLSVPTLLKIDKYSSYILFCANISFFLLIKILKLFFHIQFNVVMLELFLSTAWTAKLHWDTGQQIGRKAFVSKSMGS